MRNVLRRMPTSFLLRINTSTDCYGPICPCLECHVDALGNGFQLLFASQAYWVAFVYRSCGLLRILIGPGDIYRIQRVQNTYSRAAVHVP